MVVGLGDGLARPVFVRGADVELLVIAAELHPRQAPMGSAAASSALRTAEIGAWSPAALLMCW